MKIAILLDEVLRTGGIRILLDYAKELSKREHDVTVLYTYFPVKFPQENIFKYFKRTLSKIRHLRYSHKNLKYFRVNNFKIKMIPYYYRILLLNYDVLMFSYWPISYCIKRIRGKQRVVYLIQAYENWYGNLKMLNESYKLPFILIAVSDYMYNLIKEKSGAAAYVIKNGLDYTKFNDLNRNTNSVSKTISFIYYKIEFKGVEDILYAINRIYFEFNNVKIKSFGLEDPDNLPDYVEYYKNPDDDIIAEIYSTTDIFICASREEGFYLAPAEAMASKCAVITTRVGAVEEFAENLISSIIVEPNEKDAIYRAIKRLLLDSMLLEKIANNGYHAIREKFNWESKIEKFEKLLSQD